MIVICIYIYSIHHWKNPFQAQNSVGITNILQHLVALSNLTRSGVDLVSLDRDHADKRGPIHTPNLHDFLNAHYVYMYALYLYTCTVDRYIYIYLYTVICFPNE